MEEQNWYGVRSLYEHTHRARGQKRLYEERIVLIHATSFEEALSKAEAEAATYATDGTQRLKSLLAFHMFNAPLDGMEVFSLMRDSRMDPDRYVKRMYETGRERVL